MKLPPDFDRTLNAMSDAQLYVMLAHYEDYLPEAIARARAELELRKLPIESVVPFRNIAEQSKAELKELETRATDKRMYWVIVHLVGLTALIAMKACNH